MGNFAAQNYMPRCKPLRRQAGSVLPVHLALARTCKMPSTSTFSWEAVSAIATSIAALGVLLALWQIWITRVIAQLQFEDALSREYRDLCTTIPAEVFLQGKLTDEEYKKTFDEFYRYIDLSNEQVSLRQRGRISRTVWESWCAGIKYNLGLPAIARAWGEVKAQTPSFQELRQLEASGFNADPSRWPKARHGAG